MSHAIAGVVPRVLVASASVRAPRERPHAALRRRLRGAAPARAFFGKDDAYPATLRPPMPLPEAVAVGLSCAVSGAKTALASPSDAWKPLTGAVAALALALDGAGFVAVSKVLSPGDDAGALARLFSELTIVAADGVCLLLAPLVALAVVQQVLPLLGEKILFDGARAAAASAAAAAAASGAPDAEAPAFRLARTRLARLEAIETSDGLGLRGLGVAASRTGTLASLTATAAPVGAAATLVPVVGPVLAASLAALVASYALSWELLDPYFDKKGFGYEQQDKIMWANRFALCAFAAPFTVALAVPLFGPLAAAVAQGAAGTALWRVLEPDDEGDEGGD